MAIAIVYAARFRFEMPCFACRYDAAHARALMA